MHLTFATSGSRDALTRACRACVFAVLAACLACPGAHAQAAQATSTTLTVTTPSGATAGAVETLTASVLAAGQPAAGGLVTFYDGKIVLGTAQIITIRNSNSPGALDTAVFRTRLGIGAHSLVASYAGAKGVYAASKSAAQSVTVAGSFPVTVSLTPSSNSSPYALTATATETGSATLPSGSISFADLTSNYLQLGTAPLAPGSLQTRFLPASSYSIDGHAQGIVSADFNGDGIPDLAFASENSNGPNLYVLLGNGDGTYQVLTSTIQYDRSGFNGVASIEAMAVGDFDGDGVPDLALTLYEGIVAEVVVLPGNGDGTFKAMVPDPTLVGASPGVYQTMAVGDFNGDGIPDLAIVDPGDDSVAVLLGDGDSTFKYTKYLSTGTNGYDMAVVAGDFNGDGISDLAVATEVPNTITVLVGNGDGTFKVGASLPQSNEPYTLAVSDFNGDGIPDLAIANGFFNNPSNAVTVLLGDGAGSFKAGSSFGPQFTQSAVVAGDFNGDGIAEPRLLKNPTERKYSFYEQLLRVDSVFWPVISANALIDLFRPVDRLTGN